MSPEIHPVGFFKRMPTGASTAFVKPTHTEEEHVNQDQTAQAIIRDFIDQYEMTDARVWAQSPDEAAPELVDRLRQQGFEIASKLTAVDVQSNQDEDSEDESDLALLRTLVGPRNDLPFGVWAEQTMRRILTRMEQLSDAITEEQK